MPVDKFGRHLHRHREPEVSDVLLVESVSDLFYDAILRFVGVQGLNNTGTYILMNGTPQYQISAYDRGVITSVNRPLATGNVRIVVNNLPYDPEDMIGKRLRIGDVIKFQYPQPIPPLIPLLFVEICLKVPIIAKT